MCLEENLPVAVEDLPQDIEVKDIATIEEAKEKFNEFIKLTKMLEIVIENSKEKCDDAKYSVQEAHDYDDAWYKIGSGKKKRRMITEAQVDLAEAVSSLQQGQALSFHYQRKLAEFCAICLSFAQKNEKQLTDLSNLLVEFVKKSEKEPAPSYVLDQVNSLRKQLEERKAEIEKQKKNKKIMFAAAIVIIVVLGSLLFATTNI